jgi:hypothetical protein
MKYYIHSIHASLPDQSIEEKKKELAKKQTSKRASPRLISLEKGA